MLNMEIVQTVFPVCCSYSDPDADPATDQNAWVQSGTTDQTPYSAIGVDGTGYVLGMKT